MELGGSKDDMVEILNCTETEKYIPLFSTISSFEAPSSTPGEDRTYALADFFVRNLMLKNFYLKLFLDYCVFLVVFSTKVNVFFCFCTI